MKQKIILTVLVFALAILSARAQTSTFQLVTGAGYSEQVKHGDLSYQFIDLRLLPLFGNGHDAELGLHANATQYSSGFDDYVLNGTEYSGGIALNWYPRLFYLTDFCSWYNLDYKISENRGGINTLSGPYRHQQKDKLICFSGGLIFMDKDGGAFPIREFRFTYQNSISSDSRSTFNENIITGGAWNSEYFQALIQSSIYSIRLNPSGSLNLDPTPFVAYSYESGNYRAYLYLGLKMIIRSDENKQELIVLGFDYKSCAKQPPTLQLEASANLSQILRSWHNR